MAISLAQAKTLCSANELALVRFSTRDEIGKLSAGQLQQKIKRAREARDKWSDQSRGQRRATQAAQKSRGTEANARSVQKAQLFGEALGRFESQLAKLESQSKSGATAPKRVAPRVRSAGHRADRAEARSSLKEERLNLKSSGKGSKLAQATPKKVTKPQATEVSAMSAPETAMHADKPMADAKPSRPKKKPPKTKLSALQAAREVQGLHVTKGKQLRASTAAKQSRLKASGIVRIQKSTSAANKRRQAKRDSR
ncbi:MAG TPA: hypothetical protein VH107_03430 [Lacipirellulaceae bacterium]|jgi:hypothetical protein|nr:hypothetical protein [Lacipirellulaceae bacterium]